MNTLIKLSEIMDAREAAGDEIREFFPEFVSLEKVGDDILCMTFEEQTHEDAERFFEWLFQSKLYKHTIGLGTIWPPHALWAKEVVTDATIEEILNAISILRDGNDE